MDISRADAIQIPQFFSRRFAAIICEPVHGSARFGTLWTNWDNSPLVSLEVTEYTDGNGSN
jgi:hypothetical protein